MGDGGKVVRILGSVHDQTETKRVERVLRRAKETAVQTSQAKSEFLANVSHELRTPLNAIIGFSEVMIQEILGPVGSERYRDYANDIRQRGAHLLGVIDDLLDYSKLEAVRLELYVEPVPIGEVIERSVRMMREPAESEDVTLVSEKAETDCRTDADERKIAKILLNLVSKAIKFTPAGGTVTVSAKESGDGLDIRVADSGIGMSDSDVELALSPFGQVDSVLNRQHTRTGRGLPLSKSLAELHGGYLKIESRPGKGTTVTVHLNRAVKKNGSGPTLRLVMGGQVG